MVKRPKSTFAFLILTFLIYSVSCLTVFAEEQFSLSSARLDKEEDFTSSLSGIMNDADTEPEPEEMAESDFSSDEAMAFVSDPSDLSGVAVDADTGFQSEVTSASVFSSEETQLTPDEESEYDPKEEYSGFIVNPLWADIVTEEDLRRMVEELPAEDITAPVGSLDVVYYDNPHDCLAVVKNAMLNHRGYVSFGYHCEDDDYPDPTDFTDEIIWGQCFEHSGNPKMGDTLRGNMVGAYWVYVADKEKSNGVNYTYVLRFIWSTTMAQEKELDTAVARVITLLNETGASSDFEKISFLYNYITEHVEYDYYNLENKEEMIHFTAYSAPEEYDGYGEDEFKEDEFVEDEFDE